MIWGIEVFTLERIASEIKCWVRRRILPHEGRDGEARSGPEYRYFGPTMWISNLPKGCSRNGTMCGLNGESARFDLKLAAFERLPIEIEAKLIFGSYVKG
jgi:hypothetical protein